MPRHRGKARQPQDQGGQDGGTAHTKGKGKGQDKGGGTPFAPLPPSTQWLTPPMSPFHQDPQQSSTAGPFSSSMPQSSSVMQPFGRPRQEAVPVDSELIALRQLHAQVKNQSVEQTDDVKKALAVLEAVSRKEDSKSYRQLVGLLDKARKKLSDIEEQWEEFRKQWTSYLDNATKMWAAHIDSYEEGETKFSQKRKEAADHLQLIRTQLHEVHVRTMAKEGAISSGDLEEGQTALDATMAIEEMENVAAQPQFLQLKTDLKGAVQRVRDTIEERIQKRPLPSRPGDGEEVEILEPADKRPRDSN